MRPQLRIRLRRVGVRIARTGQDRGTLDARVQTLFAERQTLEGGEGVFFRGAAVYCISYEWSSSCGLELGVQQGRATY